MDGIRSQLNKPLVVGIIALIIGLIIGWFVIGWGLWPVSWTDASPQLLQAQYREDYLRMAIDSYALNQDATLAKQRFDSLGSEGNNTLQAVKANPGKISPVDIGNFSTAVQAAPVASTTPATPLPSQGGGKFNPLIILFIMCGLTVLLGLAFGAFYLLRNRGSGNRGPATPAMQAQEAARQAQWTDYSGGAETSPIAQFMASYKVGDDLFDDSFSIDSPSGEFLGECGVGISETIGVGDPKKVTAFEVWLFDKNDIQTVTKVLMSAHAFNDSGIRSRLQAKGEPVLLEPGNQTGLETATLRMTTRVVDMNYGEGALPDKSFLESLILEIAVWPK